MHARSSITCLRKPRIQDGVFGDQGLSRRVLVRSVRLMRGAPISCSAASRSLASMSPVTNRQSSISVDDNGADSGLERAQHRHIREKQTKGPEVTYWLRDTKSIWHAD